MRESWRGCPARLWRRLPSSSRVRRLIARFAPLVGVVAVALLGAWFVVPALRQDPSLFAWATGACAVIAALGDIARLRRLRSSGALAPPSARPLPLGTQAGPCRVTRARAWEGSHRYHGGNPPRVSHAAEPRSRASQS